MYKAILLLLIIPLFSRAQAPVNPLATYSPIWNQPRYTQCNTGAHTGYLTAKEKELVWVLNMARLNPSLFLSTVVNAYPQRAGQERLVNVREYGSLKADLAKTGPLGILQPDSLCRVSALCHAQESGASGYVGHDRFSKACADKEHFMSECCDYGFENAVDIVMHLLVDEDVSSLGHRHALLGNFQKIGTSIQPHKVYAFTAVLDFY